MSSEDAPPVHGEEEAASHDPEGLDLARAAARAASTIPGQGVRRRSAGGSRRTSSDARSTGSARASSRLSGAHPDDRDPQLLGPSLDRLIARNGWEMDLKVQGVFGRWAELVGGEVSAHTTPETLVDGKLVVRTDSTAWATQLKLLAASIVRRLNEELGHGTVLTIDVVGPHLPSWKKGRYGVRDGRGPRDTYG